MPSCWMRMGWRNREGKSVSQEADFCCNQIVTGYDLHFVKHEDYNFPNEII